MNSSLKARFHSVNASVESRCGRLPTVVLWTAVVGLTAGLSHVAWGASGTDTSKATDKTNETSPSVSPVANFSLKDFRGKAHSLNDYDKSSVVVLAFLGTECPLARLYAPRLNKLAEELGPQGVTFLGIMSNRQDSITELQAFANRQEIGFPLLKDLGNELADTLGAERTPEIVVLDRNRVVRYRGRVDDQYVVGVIRDVPTRQDLRLAIEDLLAGRTVAIPRTEPMGCLIGRVREPDETSPVIYSNQIAKILVRHCVECHRPGEIAPFSLTDYEEVVGWGDMILEVVRQGRMPPWHASPEFGEFVNARRMSFDEIALLEQWVAAGSPQGDPQDLPELPQYVSGWQLPVEPDLVVNMRDEPFNVPAEGTVKYQYFRVDPQLTEDRWIKGAEIVPGNRAVVHHVIVFVKPPKGNTRRLVAGGEGFLTAYVPGKRVQMLPAGMAKHVPAGSEFVFQLHYTPIGTPQRDLTKVGLIFANADEVQYEVVTQHAGNRRLDIPPYDGHHRVEATTGSYPFDVKLLSLSPHMHLRGKSFRFEIISPDDKRRTVLDVPRYDFNWQTSYVLAETIDLPAGTRMHCVAHFDNSEDNLANPDPSARVHWGDQTWNEMMLGYFDVAIPLDDVRNGVQRMGGAAAQIRERIVDEIFSRADTNQDGRLLRDEVPEKRLELFDRIDTDGNGQVDRAELLKAVAAYQKME